MRKIELDKPATNRFSDFGGYTYDAGEPPTLQDAHRSLVAARPLNGPDQDPAPWPTAEETEAELVRLTALFNAGQWSRAGRR